MDDSLHDQMRRLEILLRRAAYAEARVSGNYHRAYYGTWESYETCEHGQCPHCHAMAQRIQELEQA